MTPAAKHEVICRNHLAGVRKDRTDLASSYIPASTASPAVLRMKPSLTYIASSSGYRRCLGEEESDKDDLQRDENIGSVSARVRCYHDASAGNDEEHQSPPEKHCRGLVPSYSRMFGPNSCRPNAVIKAVSSIISATDSAKP